MPKSGSCSYFDTWNTDMPPRWHLSSSLWQDEDEPSQAPTHHMPPAGQRDEDVAAFMDQQLAVDAPVALPRETPYPLAALATVSSLRTGTAAVRPSQLALPGAQATLKAQADNNFAGKIPHKRGWTPPF